MPIQSIASFDDLSSKDKALNALQRAFKAAGAEPVEVTIDPRIRRTSGINYRQVHFLFADSQQVVMHIKRPGDVYRVKLNGSEMPIKDQDDQKAAIAEIVARMDSKRPSFQKRLAKKKVVVPKGVTVTRPKRKQLLTDQVTALKAEHAELEQRLEAAQA